VSAKPFDWQYFHPFFPINIKSENGCYRYIGERFQPIRRVSPIILKINAKILAYSRFLNYRRLENVFKTSEKILIGPMKQPCLIKGGL